MSVQTAFRLDSSILESLKSLAKDDGRSMTWHANKALRAYLKLDKKNPLKLPASNDVQEVIEHLNLRAGTKYRNTETNAKLIRPRIEQFSVEDCKIVIDKKCQEWLNTEMEKYLRPATLFQASKFEGYLNQRIVENVSVQDTRSISTVDLLSDRSWAQ